ncbi:MAG: rhomboid family intramembrane serine protease [Gilvibacter sp.]
MSNSLAYKYKSASVLIKIIVINIAVFLVFYLGSFILNIPEATAKSWFVLPTDFSTFILQPWSIVTYIFLHSGFWHIFWNMLILYYFGNYVENLFRGKRLLTIFLLGGIAGGLLYMLAYNLFPAFTNEGINGKLQGASAAVYAVMVFIATYSPNSEMRIFKWNIKLWHIALFFVLKDLISLPASGNAGGLIAHMGGALFGYLYATQLTKGNDIGAWFDRLMDSVSNMFSTRKKAPFKKVHKNKTTYQSSGKKRTTDERQQQIDAILDKISKSGYESLSKKEKDFLFKAGNDTP